MPAKKKLRTEAQWEFNDGSSWALYNSTDAAMLEKEYVTKKSVGSFVTTNFSFNAGYNTNYTVDFDKMEQTNQASGKVRPIRRVAPFGEVSWEYIDDNNLFVQFYDEDTNEIESLYCDNGLNVPVKTKKLTWNKGYNSVYTFTFTNEKKDANGKIVEVLGTQKNEDSGKVRQLKRTPKKLPWAVEGYGISGDKDALATMQNMAAAAAAQQQQQQNAPSVVAIPAGPPTIVAVAPVVTSPSVPAPAVVAAAVPVTVVPTATSAPSAVAAGPGLLIKEPTLSLPHTWEKAKMFDAVGGHHEVHVSPNSEEYKIIANSLLTTINKKVNIVHILRLENAAMYMFYAMTRQSISTGEATLAANANSDNKGSMLAAAKEKLLFTGERVGTNMLAIKKFGFDTRVAPADGAFGQGLYFGANASFADNGRCIQNADGTKDMFVCRVTVGNAAKGTKGIRRPPPLDPKKPTMALYDSCVDDEKNPTLHIIFNNKQAYPEYIVRYI